MFNINIPDKKALVFGQDLLYMKTHHHLIAHVKILLNVLIKQKFTLIQQVILFNIRFQVYILVVL